METITIREIIEQVERGQIRIPAFQRGFVWEPDRVAFLMDSIFKNYPFGALLFWRARQVLKAERNLGPFPLPEPKADYPVDYVLDGQQRITSLYATFQTSTPMPNDTEWRDIYFDYSLPLTAQETQFFALTANDVDPKRHFPLRALFDTVAYRKATADFEDAVAKKIDDMQAVFKETRIPVQMFTTEDKATVAVIFERINRQGVPLDTLQLLSAWTWSEDFQLQEQFSELSTDLEDYGLKDQDTDENLLLRCCSAILANDPAPGALITLPGEDVRRRFGEVENGIKGALDFLRINCNVYSIKNLPFQTILVPLSLFFATSGTTEIAISSAQRDCLLRWFWRTAFSKRYSSGVLRNLQEDIDGVTRLKQGDPSRLGNFSMGSFSYTFFIGNPFSLRNVNTKSFILLLASAHPLSFVSGAPVNLSEKLKEYNKTEFHHLMPRAFLKSGAAAKSYGNLINHLANIAFMSRSDNRTLGGVAPSVYRSLMAANVEEILEHAICPDNLFEDNFGRFVVDRARMLARAAKTLMGFNPNVELSEGEDVVIEWSETLMPGGPHYTHIPSRATEH